MSRVRICGASRLDYGIWAAGPRPAHKPVMLFGCPFDFTKLGCFKNPYLCVKVRPDNERARPDW